MAYLDQHYTSNRKTIIVTVALLHGVAIYAIVTGLAVKFVNEPIAIFEGRNIPEKKPPPPEPRQERKPRTDERSTIFVPKPPIPMPAPRDPDILTHPGPIPVPIPQPVPTASAEPIPLPQPKPSFAARSARPRGKPTDWVTSNDYPARDLREGNQGLARYSLLVGADGRVSSCVVTTSSGHPGLDEATCQMVTRRARFEPATDETGGRVQGSYSGSVRWLIPAE